MIPTLFLSQKSITALIIDGNGRKNEISCFSFGTDTEVYRSCSLTWENNFYIYGGYKNRRQISQVIGNKLFIVGELDFYFSFGSCDVMGRDIFLCFSENEMKRCRRARSPLKNFSRVNSLWCIVVMHFAFSSIFLSF